MNPMSKVSQVRISSPLFSGLVYAFIIMLIAAILTSLVVAFSQVEEKSLTTMSYVIHFLSLFIGGLVSGRRAGSKGWYHGGIMGVIYAAIVILVGFLGFDAPFHINGLILLVSAFLIAALGGIMGVNARK